MAEKIEADYQQLATIAKNFAQEADTVEQMLKIIQTHLDNLEGGGWIGRGANSFFAEMHDDVLPGVQRLQAALEEASRVSGEIARMFREAEETASNRFRVA